MNLGINIHSDWEGCPNIRWLRDNTIVRNVRIDFPCNSTLGNAKMLAQLSDVLRELDFAEHVMIHVGYLDDCTPADFERFSTYIYYVVGRLVHFGFAERSTIELWNNVNIEKYWPWGQAKFKKLLAHIQPAIDHAKESGIQVAGFSITLDAGNGWDWLSGLRDNLAHLDYLTVQIYPTFYTTYEDMVNRLRTNYQDHWFAIAETGAEGKAGDQLCKYRQLMRDVEKHTPNIPVYIYHLFYVRKDSYELITWKDGKITEKPAIKYLKRIFSLAELEADYPKDMYCSNQSNIFKKIICFLKKLFS